MLYCEIDNGDGCSSIFEIFENNVASRENSLQDAKAAPIPVPKNLYKGLIEPGSGASQCVRLEEGKYVELSGSRFAMPPCLVSCAMVTAYPPSGEDGGVCVYHARGGDVSGCELLQISDKQDRIIVYAVRKYESDSNDNYDECIATLLNNGYKSENLCIITGFANNVLIGSDGAMVFC